MKLFPVLTSVALLTAALPASAAMKTGEMSPKPNVAVSDVSVSLTLGDAVEDDVLVQDPGIRKLQVEGFHAALQTGFDYAFTGGAAYNITLHRADVGMVAGAVDGGGMVVAATSQITFQASVVSDETGDTCKVAGTATAKRTVSSPKHAGSVVESAMETMIESIAAECLGSDE